MGVQGQGRVVGGDVGVGVGLVRAEEGQQLEGAVGPKLGVELKGAREWSRY
jgi:hypothetical protein